MRRFTMKVLVLAVMATLIAVTFAQASDRGPVITAGSETVGEEELVNLIVEQSGANQMMRPFVLAQMSLEDRESFVQQVSVALLLSEAAKNRGLHLDPGVASQLRWNAVNVLAQAYVASVSSRWDLGRPALEKWFNDNQEYYMEPEAVHVRHILVETESEALDALVEVFARDGDFRSAAARRSIDTGSAQGGGDLGWVYRGQTVPEFDEMAFSLEPGKIGGPVQSRFGWHVIQVLDKKPARMPSFDEALRKVREDMQQHYLAVEIERLGESLGLELNHEIISTLGGFPAFRRNQ